MWPHLIYASLDAPDSTYQTASRSVQPFLHKSRQTVPMILYNEPPLSPPLKPAHLHWDLDQRLTHGSLGQPESTTQTASRSVHPYLQTHDRDRQTDRQTGHATRFVTVGRINIRIVLRWGLIAINIVLYCIIVLYQCLFLLRRCSLMQRNIAFYSSYCSALSSNCLLTAYWLIAYR